MTKMKNIVKQKKYVSYLILVGVLIIPVLYSYFYLGAFWDPYSKLDKVPVAIVNEDKGATINGKSRNLGTELCDQLKDDGSLNFAFTDAATAQNGLEKTEYYAVLTIPSDFSSNIATSSDTKKKPATITYCSNEKRNYLASQILNSAVVKIEQELRTSVTKEIVAELSSKLQEVPTQLQTLSDGLNKLNHGASSLADGTNSLEAGAIDLNSGANKLVTGTTSLKNGATTLTDATSRLKDGTNQLLTGSNSLASGLTTFQSKMKEYLSGVTSAYDGSTKLASGIDSLNTGIVDLLKGATTLEHSTATITDLKDGAASLATGATSLQAGITSYTSGVNTLITNVSQTTQALAQYAAATKDPTISAIVAQLTSKENLASLQALESASTTLNQGAASLKAGAETLSAGTNNLGELKAAISQIKNGLKTAQSGSSALNSGAKDLSNGLASLNKAKDSLKNATSQLTNGATSLSNGLTSLYTGIDKVNSGSISLSEGINKVNEGSVSLQEGTNSLVSGTTTLNNGATELSDGVKTAQDKVDSSLTDANSQVSSLNGLDTYAGNAVSIEKNSYAPVPNYGTAFAPYFMSLSLWVGGLMIFFGIYFDPDHKFKLLSRHSSHVIKRTFAYFVIGLLQAVFLGIVLIIALGLTITNMPLYFASCCLVSLVFISIIQLLLLYFSNIGKFFAIALLILQLTSCGGTFPMETVPNIFKALFPYMPMTYSVGLFKEAISGVGDNALIWHNAGILIGILVVVMALTTLFYFIRHSKDNSQSKSSGDDLAEVNSSEAAATLRIIE